MPIDYFPWLKQMKDSELDDERMRLDRYRLANTPYDRAIVAEQDSRTLAEEGVNENPLTELYSPRWEVSITGPKDRVDSVLSALNEIDRQARNPEPEKSEDWSIAKAREKADNAALLQANATIEGLRMTIAEQAAELRRNQEKLQEQELRLRQQDIQLSMSGSDVYTPSDGDTVYLSLPPNENFTIHVRAQPTNADDPQGPGPVSEAEPAHDPVSPE